MRKTIGQKLRKIFSSLQIVYGKQGWWPTTPDRGSIPQYRGSVGRLTEKQRLEICIGAILAQNTSWSNAEKAVIQINKHKEMNTTKLASRDIMTLAEQIRSSGYYNQKAKTIKNFLHVFGNKPLSQHFKKKAYALRKELLQIKGIGKETADSIILYAAKKPIFVVDAYTKRILNRLGFKQQTYEEFQQLFHLNLKRDVRIFNEYHALLVKFGKELCKKKPICNLCFLKKECLYFKKNAK